MTNSKRSGPTERLALLRSEISQIALLALLLAISASVFAAVITSTLEGSKRWQLTVATLVAVLALVSVYRFLFTGIEGRHRFEGIIFLEKDTRAPVAVPRYMFSSEFTSSVNALTVENDAFARMWSENKFYETIENVGFESRNLTSSGELAIEAVEYFVLETLSTRLTDYFNSEATINKVRLVEYERTDLPDVLLANRFVENLSRPMEERAVFADRKRQDKPRPPIRGKIISAFGPKGARYQRFDLTLPKEASVSRVGRGRTVIKTPRFNVELSASVSGAHAFVESDFIELYMKKKWSEIDCMKCTIDVIVDINLLRSLTPAGWGYYKWIDSFLDELENKTHFQTFLSNIGWKQALTVHLISESR